MAGWLGMGWARRHQTTIALFFLPNSQPASQRPRGLLPLTLTLTLTRPPLPDLFCPGRLPPGRELLALRSFAMPNALGTIDLVRAYKYDELGAAFKGGTNPNAAFNGVMPLHTAVNMKDTAMCAFLVDWGADALERVDHTKRTALELAKERKLDKITRVFEDAEYRSKVLGILRAELDRTAERRVTVKRRKALFGAAFALFMAVVSTVCAYVSMRISPALEAWLGQYFPWFSEDE